MISMLAVVLAIVPLDAVITRIRVVPADGRTEVVIDVDGDVVAKTFLFAEPSRVVLELASVELIAAVEHMVERGGVRTLYVTSAGPDTVRIVIELAQPVQYRMEQTPGAVRVSFPNGDGEFVPWNAGPVQQQPPITVTFTEESIANVLAVFAEFAGRSIVPSSEIKGNLVTAEVRNQNWRVALQVVLSANNLVAEELESGVILVKDAARTKARQLEEPLIARQYRVEFATADSLLTAVQGLISTEGAKAVANRSTNSLIITETPSVLERIEPVLRQLDVREPQVHISATFAFVDRTALEQLGITYDVKDSRGNQLNQRTLGMRDTNGNGVIEPGEVTAQDVVVLGGSSVAALGNANHPVPSPTLQIVSSLLLGRHTLVSFIEALQTMALSDIQAKPVLTVMNHRQATIQVGQETPVRVIDVGGARGLGGAAAAAQAPVATVEFKNTGIILKVTPHVTGNQVLLDMHAERSDAIATSSDIGVVFTTQNATTQVLVDDGETAVIAGLTVTEKSRVRTGIPLLMHIPVLGALFRNTREVESKRDLLIMVTPRIIRE